MLPLIRALHTLVFGVMFGAILFLLYCGMVNHLSGWTAIAFVTIAIEGVIYASNGMTCPLRTWTERLTPTG